VRGARFPASCSPAIFAKLPRHVTSAAVRGDDDDAMMDKDELMSILLEVQKCEEEN
jgi:hypothetical protein